MLFWPFGWLILYVRMSRCTNPTEVHNVMILTVPEKDQHTEGGSYRKLCVAPPNLHVKYARCMWSKWDHTVNSHLIIMSGLLSFRVLMSTGLRSCYGHSKQLLGRHALGNPVVIASNSVFGDAYLGIDHFLENRNRTKAQFGPMRGMLIFGVLWHVL